MNTLLRLLGGSLFILITWAVVATLAIVANERRKNKQAVYVGFALGLMVATAFLYLVGN